MTDPVLHSLNQTKSSSQKMGAGLFLGLVAVVVIVGTSIGYVAAASMQKGPSVQAPQGTKVNTEKAAGIVDKKTFKDNSEGVLREGGIDGEGSFHLERPGGKSQYVYLTSTTVDLGAYEGKKVRVWGQTFEGQKAGWLMDVGLIEVLN